jgi:hypothetical protein
MDPTRRLCAFCKREREREREQSGTKERCEIRCPKGEISKEQNQEVWFLKEGVFYCLMNISSFLLELSCLLLGSKSLFLCFHFLVGP